MGHLELLETSIGKSPSAFTGQSLLFNSICNHLVQMLELVLWANVDLFLSEATHNQKRNDKPLKKH